MRCSAVRLSVRSAVWKLCIPKLFGEFPLTDEQKQDQIVADIKNRVLRKPLWVFLSRSVCQTDMNTNTAVYRWRAEPRPSKLRAQTSGCDWCLSPHWEMRLYCWGTFPDVPVRSSISKFWRNAGVWCFITVLLFCSQPCLFCGFPGRRFCLIQSENNRKTRIESLQLLAHLLLPHRNYIPGETKAKGRFNAGK